LQGSFRFNLQRFICKETGEETDFLAQNGLDSGYISLGLKAFMLEYAQLLSYEKTSQLLKKVSGVCLFTGQRIETIVVAEAEKLANLQKTEIEANTQKMPEVETSVDLYDSENAEVLILMDGIGVKAQKKKRKVETTAENKPDKMIYTNVALVQKADNEFISLMAGYDSNGEETHSLVQAVQNQLSKEYGKSKEKLNVVAITDGARTIRLTLETIFGVVVPLILDWFHLSKKINDLMSMIAPTKEEKERLIHVLKGLLWQGKTLEAIESLKNMEKVKNETKWRELIGYLEKHEHEIIDYGKRQTAGKGIGSGQMEKGVDLVIGSRQKKKGMSWSKKGSRSLAVLKNEALNLENTYLSATRKAV